MIGDIVPAGKGIQNVQLLIVNRDDPTKLCGAGEVGGIVMRAAGLAEINPEKNKEKFLGNWFVDNKWVEADNEEAWEGNLKSWEALSSTEKDLAEQWATLIRGLNAKNSRPESDFFEGSGHGLLAQQLLLNIRQKMSTNFSINSLYSSSSLDALSAQLDRLREGKDDTGATGEGEPAYAQSLDKLLGSLDAKYQTAGPATLTPQRKTTVFMTGAAGFLGLSHSQGLT
ncbi:large subunit of alpha-aminoadipate reductase [Metarhizium acridum]|uniref:large subunit of alpha-aminoadipate reductase n=1 Tax=Metarhizium acridum TaxID=92637 RepID=UPI001C6CBFB9|nr:large subunit of alpha-aminoadipate reductase [Metarhizium acridum]